MKTKTKERIGIACIGIPLSALSIVIGAGLVGCLYHFNRYGMRPPEYFGWTGAFVLFGTLALILVAPALILMLTLGIIWNTPIKRHALLSATLSLFLGSIAIALCLIINPQHIALSGLIISAATCLAITVVIEVAFRKYLQNKGVQAIGDKSPQPDP